jgi:hypothetical protein
MLFGNYYIVTINRYFINGYWWFLLVAIGGYLRLNYHRLLMVTNGYFINGYWWILYYKLLVDILLTNILLVDIGGYYISGYQWLLY